MAKYLIITRFLPGSEPHTLPERSQRVHDALEAIDPNFLDRWSCEYVIVGGSIGAIDVIESDDEEQVRAFAAAIERFGECTTETARAVPWREFIDSIPPQLAAASTIERRDS